MNPVRTIITLLLLLPLANRTEAQGVRAEISPSQANVGGLEIGKPATFSLNLKNLGTGAMEVKRVRTNRVGVRAEVEPVPGREGRDFKVRVSIELEKPGKFWAYVYAETNDPKRPEVKALVFGSMIPKEARIHVFAPYELKAKNSWLFEERWVVDIANPLSEINRKVNEQGYKEHRVILKMHNLASSPGYQRLKQIEQDDKVRFAGPTALLAGGRLLQSHEAQKHFVSKLIEGEDYTLASIQRLAAEAAKLNAGGGGKWIALVDAPVARHGWFGVMVFPKNSGCILLRSRSYISPYRRFSTGVPPENSGYNPELRLP